ncbi:hypothetical protein ScPMuIL_016253 [Solemya velum]
MRGAINDYNFYKAASIDCRLKCSSKVDGFRTNYTELGVWVDQTFYEKVIKKSVCLKKCRANQFRHRQESEGEKDRHSIRTIDEAFAERRPYGYLHYCYYKLEQYKDAAAAAYTFYLANPHDMSVLESINYYRNLDDVEVSDFVDLERKDYQKLRMEAETAYKEEKWEESRKKIEQALAAYYKEEERCRAHCEEVHSPNIFPDFDVNVADLYITVLLCQFGCEDKLSVLLKDKEENYLAEHYNYLQFLLYKLNHVDLAVEAVATALLLNPDDIDMRKNRAFYVMNLGYHQAHFIPRKEAVDYVKRRQEMDKLLKYVMDVYDTADQEDEDLFTTDEQSSSDGIQSSSLLHQKDHYMKRYEQIGIKLKAGSKELKGKLRFVADGLLREEQCEELISVLKMIKPEEQIITNLTVSEIMESAKEEEENEVALRMFLRVSEVIRHYTGQYFNQSAFFIRQAVIMCQQPNSGKDFTEGCIQQSDGSCLQSNITKTSERHYIAIIYLNDLTDGHMYFLDKDNNKQSKVEAKCGRLIGFQASDRYGWNGLSKKDRCVLVLQFTIDRTEDDNSHRKAMTQLYTAEQTKKKGYKNNRTQMLKHFDNEGLKLSMNETDLLGKDRFVVDGMANEDQCRMLMELAKMGAIIGDGYDGDQSPHSDHELYMGLSVHGASKLVDINAINKDVVQLYLDLTEKGRLWEENYLNLSTVLYFDFTHLVCRKALDDGVTSRDDLSHQVHADNCVIQRDGTCRKEFPAYIQRDYSGLLYLNDDFEGGEFFFAHPNQTEQIALKPKCGRMVGFNAGDYHGVKAVMKGQRCALAMWFTTDSNFKELAHIKARKTIHKLNQREMWNSRDEL